MKKYRFLAPIAVLILVSLACGAPTAILNRFENGEITFVNPIEGSTFHEDVGALPPLTITINSTFERPTTATLGYEGSLWTCTLDGFGKDTPCPPVSVLSPGIHTITAQVQKLDGSMVNAQTTFTWTPWSPLEKGMSKVAGILGQDDPKWGFNIVGLLISAIIALLIAKITGGSTTGTVLGGIVVLVAFFYFAPAEVVKIFVESIYGIATGYFLILIIKSMHFFHARRADGASVTYLGPAGEAGGRMIESIGKHGNNLMGQSAGGSPNQQYLPPGYEDQPPQILPGTPTRARRTGLAKLLRGE